MNKKHIIFTFSINPDKTLNKDLKKLSVYQSHILKFSISKANFIRISYRISAKVGISFDEYQFS